MTATTPPRPVSRHARGCVSHSCVGLGSCPGGRFWSVGWGFAGLSWRMQTCGVQDWHPSGDAAAWSRRRTCCVLLTCVAVHSHNPRWVRSGVWATQGRGGQVPGLQHAETSAAHLCWRAAQQERAGPLQQVCVCVHVCVFAACRVCAGPHRCCVAGVQLRCRMGALLACLFACLVPSPSGHDAQILFVCCMSTLVPEERTCLP